MKGELVENRIVVWSASESRRLFGSGYYGRPIGMPKPKLDEIDVPLVLDLIEGLYLMQKGRITVFQSKRKITEARLLEACRAQYHNFEKKYLVYQSFRDKGYVINPGIKFGCDFAVYERGPGVDHAPYLIQVYDRRDVLTPTGVVLAGRLATTVRKQFILAIPRGKNKIDLLALDWWRA